jgi:hypothetical protein
LKTSDEIRVYDIINIEYSWIKELLGYSGYDKEETTSLIEYILDDMENTAASYPGLQKECQNMRKALPSLLNYIDGLRVKSQKKHHGRARRL